MKKSLQFVCHKWIVFNNISRNLKVRCSWLSLLSFRKKNTLTSSRFILADVRKRINRISSYSNKRIDLILFTLLTRWHKKRELLEVRMLRCCNLLLHLHWTIFHNFTKPGFNRMVRHRTLQGNPMAAARELFGNHVISRFGDIPWPPRSPDLSVCDFFLVGLP